MVTVLSTLVLCACCKAPTEPTSPPPPPPSVSNPAHPTRLALSPDLDDGAGVRGLIHLSSEVPARKNVQLPDDVVVLPVGTPTELKGIAGGFSGGCAFESGWELDFGMGPVEDLLVRWADTDKSGAVTMTPPREAEGVSMLAAGCVPGTDVSVSKMIAIGESALSALERVEDEYLPLRKDDIALPKGYPGDDPVSSVVTKPLLIFFADADADGEVDVISYSFRSWLDDEGVQLAQAGEIGILWSQRERRPSFGSFGLSQGVAFPSFHVVPPELDGGAFLFYGVHRCCGGTTVRYLHLKDDVFSEETFVTMEGDREVYLLPSKEGSAKVVIE